MLGRSNSMSLSRWRRLHRRLALFVGVQVVLWCASGAYMVWMSLDFIRGDSLVKAFEQPVALPSLTTLNQVIATYPDSLELQLRSLHPGPLSPEVLDVTTKERRFILDATTLAPMKVDSRLIEAVARGFNARQDVGIEHVKLITEQAPQEMAGRALPLWQVRLADPWQTHLYFSADNARLVAKRHDYWRIFDAMWMLHIMDYDSRSNVHNGLLRVCPMILHAPKPIVRSKILSVSLCSARNAIC